MKIKRKEYERLVEAAGKLSNLERIQMVIRTIAADGTQPELLRTNLLHYIDRFAIWSDAPFTQSPGWIAGPIQLEFVRVVTGYDFYVKQKFGASCPETTVTTSPGMPGTELASETKEAIDALVTRLSQEGETTTENGKTDDASPPNASPDDDPPERVPSTPRKENAHASRTYRPTTTRNCGARQADTPDGPCSARTSRTD